MAVSFDEPSPPDLLTFLSFVYFLQIARNAAQHLVGAGLLGEIAVGIIYGPVASILRDSWEETLLVLGYIGLVLIVFEGGLDLDPDLFIPTLPLATTAALTGVLVPIALTFALFLSPAFAFPPLQAFAAGAALASTSLGTTFFVLRAQSSTSLSSTRISSVLVSAALIDDVVALVLLSVLTSLGSGSSTSLGWTIGRPIVASIAVAIVGPAVAFLVARPLFRTFAERRVPMLGTNAALLMGVVVLSAFLAIAYYAGTTMLLGAFLAGVFLNALPSPNSTSNFKRIYEETVGSLQTYIFAPFFFASIGFTIPFLQLWSGRIIWRGIVYAILMTVGKLAVGVCVVVADALSLANAPATLPLDADPGATTEAEKTSYTLPASLKSSSTSSKSAKWLSRVHLPQTDVVPPAAFLGLALVARGEIGVLILQVAYNLPGGRLLGEEAYLVALWAVALCTIVGPIAFSALVKRYGEQIIRGRWGVQG